MSRKYTRKQRLADLADKRQLVEDKIVFWIVGYVATVFGCTAVGSVISETSWAGALVFGLYGTAAALFVVHEPITKLNNDRNALMRALASA